MSKFLSIILLIFSLSSCGLKITTEIDENVLLGSWELDRILCYLPVVSNSYVEDYNIDTESNFEVTIDFVGSDVQYMVNTDNCSTSSTAIYTADFNGTAKGLVSILKVILGSTETCDVPVVFSGNSSAGGTGTTKLTMNSNESTELNWSISEDHNTLLLDSFTGFKGSSVTGYCELNCNCVGTYTRTN